VQQPGPAAKAMSLSRPPHCGTFGTPTRCFPRAIRKTLVRRFRRSARSMHGSRNKAICSQLLYTSWVGRKRPGRIDRMPHRAWETIRRDRLGCEPSKSKIRDVKLGSNVASLAARTHKSAGADDLRKSASPRTRPSVTEPVAFGILRIRVLLALPRNSRRVDNLYK
jgi:hypothetical protein